MLVIHVVMLVINISHHRHGQDKTVSSCPCRRCELNWRQFSRNAVWTEVCLVSTQFPISNCSVSNILRTTENCLVLSPIQFTPPTRTTQDSLVLFCPCRRCELPVGIIHNMFAVILTVVEVTNNYSINPFNTSYSKLLLFEGFSAMILV